MRSAKLLLAAALVTIVAGCNQSGTAIAPAEMGPKLKITAYINVTSGCQVPTVDLVNSLAASHAQQVELEMVDFGSPEGSERWRADGMECMAILFDDGSGPSPVLQFPGEEGEDKTVVFFMPAGFSWTHEDLEQAFAALDAGKLTILSEEEARKELAPRMVEAEVDSRDVDGVGQVLINGEVLFEIKAGAEGEAATERAAKAVEGLKSWVAEPVHPGQLSLAAREGNVTVMARKIPVITVGQEDVAGTDSEGPRQLANAWLRSIKAAISGASVIEADDEV